MSRRKHRENRNIQPDSIYNNVVVAKFINQVMRKGKKTIARKIVYSAFDILKDLPAGEAGKTKKLPLEVFEKALENSRPLLEIKPKRVGGATYQVPRPVASDRSLTLAIRWILEAARNKKGKPMHEKLAEELLLASNNEGTAIKKKNDTHRMAEANRAFAHFAF